MEPIRKLDGIIAHLKNIRKRKIAVAVAEDKHTIGAVGKAVDMGIVHAIMTGHKDKIIEVAEKKGVDPSIFEIVHEPDEDKAIARSVKFVHDGDADILMKGLCSSAKYIRAILNKETGLLPKKEVLSHVTVIEVPTYPKLLIVSDVAVLLEPDLDQKVKILGYCINVAHRLGIEEPRAAILSAVEKVNPKMKSTVDAAIISKMAERGQIKGAVVDGPLALDVAVSKECVDIKHLKSGVDGAADILIFPNIEAGNIFYKSITQLAKGKIGAIVTGASAPCVLTSRADSDDSKFYSIALAAAVAEVAE